MVTTITSKNNPDQQLTAGAIAEVEVGKTVDNIKIHMRKPMQLDVMVNDVKTNQPVQNASVSISQRRASKIIPHLDLRTKTDGSGIAQVITLPGKCNFYVSHDDYACC